MNDSAMSPSTRLLSVVSVPAEGALTCAVQSWLGSVSPSHQLPGLPGRKYDCGGFRYLGRSKTLLLTQFLFLYLFQVLSSLQFFHLNVPVPLDALSCTVSCRLSLYSSHLPGSFPLPGSQS